MKIKEILLEHGSANPFPYLVSLIDLQLQQLSGIDSLNKNLIISNKDSINRIINILKSSKNWIIPEKEIKSKVKSAADQTLIYLPTVIKYIESNEIKSAIKILNEIRILLVSKSGLYFSSSPVKN